MTEIDISLISYPFTFESDLTKKAYKMVFRYQTFKELRDWGDVISPSSSVHPGDKANRMLELLSAIVVEPKVKKFSKWFNTLYELEIQYFLVQFAQAKENARKK